MQNILIKKENNNAVSFAKSLRAARIIPAVKSMEELNRILNIGGKLIFVLFGDILTIPDIVAKLKDAGKIVLIHLDLIDGLDSREVTVDFLAKNTQTDGIISTKASLVKYAKNRDLLAIQRFFMLDSMALINIEKHFPIDYVDAIEILPGLMPKIIRRIAGLTNQPIIAGGLISDEEDVQHALDAGAAAVSTTKLDLLPQVKI